MGIPEKRRFMARCSGKRWLPLAPRNLQVSFRQRSEVWMTYANIIDYLRLVIVLVGTCLVETGHPFIVGFVIILSFLLDWLDGPTARYFNQCTYLGGSLDWFGDILTNLLQVYWFARVAPAGFWGNAVVWFALFSEIAYMLFDTICNAQGRYPDVSKSCLSALLQWSVRPGTHGVLYMYTDFYALIWFTFPLTTVSLAIQGEVGHVMFQSGASSSWILLLVDGWLALMWTVGAVLSAIFIATDFELFWMLFASWTEPRDLPKEVVSIYSDIERSAAGGCALFRPLGQETDATLKGQILPKILAGTSTGAQILFENTVKVSNATDLSKLLNLNLKRDGEWTVLDKDTFLVSTASATNAKRCAAPLEVLFTSIEAPSTSVDDAAVVAPPAMGSGDVLFLLEGSRVRINSRASAECAIIVIRRKK